jgi:hypothetical protein
MGIILYFLQDQKSDDSGCGGIQKDSSEYRATGLKIRSV